MGVLTIVRPDDWHLHLRSGAMLKTVLPYTAKVFGRAIVMPNLKPPVTTTAMVKAYRDEVLAAVPAGSAFQPLMTLYLTDKTEADDVERGAKEGVLTAVKFYPAGATTNSDAGVTKLSNVYPVLERMQKIGLPLSIHGELADAEIDPFDRETAFIDQMLVQLRRDFPALKIIMEHVTTAYGIDYVMQEGPKGGLAATLTAHHLTMNRGKIFAGGIRPHYYCLPIAKREKDRLALVRAATSGSKLFFLGTDSAPHPRSSKETVAGFGGIFTAFNALAIYAHVFEEVGALSRLEAFASLNGPAFYGLPVNKDMITLEKGASVQTPPAAIEIDGGQGQVVPYDLPSNLFWRVAAS